MKKFLLFLFVLLSSAFCFADDIPLLKNPPESHGGNDNRGQALLPSVDYTAGVVTIFVPYQIEEMEVTIRDNQGVVLYSNVIPAINVQHSIVLSDTVDADKYSIQIAYDDIHLIGWF